MKEHENQFFLLDLSEIIRVNQLVRQNIDFDGFIAWYEKLSIPERCALITALFEFAYQAGVNEGMYEEALSAANINKGHPLVEKAKGFFSEYFSDLASLHNWLFGLSETDRSVVFTLAVFLFGKAEGRVYAQEDKEWCNHWWHRDLLDERVVKSILNDPKFYMTAMKDDDRIKSRWRWLRGG
ncbi:MAG TPA: DUF5958 family protein [Pyrinomonadaceae bacterium]